ncbi:MAG: TlyA family RNA methyltransferase [Planctomycetota bacterium]
MSADPSHPFVSRGGLKLDAALRAFDLSVEASIACDLGCSTGGFTDVLLRHGAVRVYAVDTGYGVLDWKLRNDPRVVVMERQNAMHVELPEPVDLVVADAGWTRQAKLLPNVVRLLGETGGDVVTLVKPHYEVPRDAVPRGGVLADDVARATRERLLPEIVAFGFEVLGTIDSPIRGSRGKTAHGNIEFLVHLRRSSDAA